MVSWDSRYNIRGWWAIHRGRGTRRVFYGNTYMLTCVYIPENTLGVEKSMRSMRLCDFMNIFSHLRASSAKVEKAEIGKNSRTIEELAIFS